MPGKPTYDDDYEDYSDFDDDFDPRPRDRWGRFVPSSPDPDDSYDDYEDDE